MNEENGMVMGERFEESYETPEPEFERDEDDGYYIDGFFIARPPEFYYIPMEKVDEMFYRLGKLNDQMAEIEDFLFDSIVEERNPIGEPE